MLTADQLAALFVAWWNKELDSNLLLADALEECGQPDIAMIVRVGELNNRGYIKVEKNGDRVDIDVEHLTRMAITRAGYKYKSNFMHGAIAVFSTLI